MGCKHVLLGGSPPVVLERPQANLAQRRYVPTARVQAVGRSDGVSEKTKADQR